MSFLQGTGSIVASKTYGKVKLFILYNICIKFSVSLLIQFWTFECLKIQAKSLAQLKISKQILPLLCLLIFLFVIHWLKEIKKWWIGKCYLYFCFSTKHQKKTPVIVSTLQIEFLLWYEKQYKANVFSLHLFSY